jgi:excinuclease ABC subunit C
MESPGFDAREFLSQLTTAPGVYRMYGESGDLLYVGKARNLKKRVASYFLRSGHDARIGAMVAQIRRVEVTLTQTEDQALLLEANLIKDQRPRYNVLYRDDKSYPYLRFAAHAYPRIAFHRGAKISGDKYFGPFASAGAVRESLATLQKLFLLRPCRDSFFAHRQRPCLQYQIKRCSGPCAGLISEEDYAREVSRAQRLLQGRGDELAEELGAEMHKASEALEFERAARLRDQIAALKRIGENRSFTGGARDMDVIAVALHAASSCVAVISIRNGVNLGHRSHFPKHPPETSAEELLDTFLGQHYLEQPAPAEVLVSHCPDDADWIAEGLSKRAQRKVQVTQPRRGVRTRMMQLALSTASQALAAHLAESATMDQRLLELQRALELDVVPRRLECFDISHTGGERTVASCVVFNEEGPLKSAYRKFNVDGITPGDDYGAIKQVVMRRYARIKGGEGEAPDVLFIDGGAGQLHAAQEALDELGIQELRIVAIAKGPARKPGLEELILPDRDQALRLPADSPALHLIQRIRDEAHRFAITGHRARRAKARVTSGLESIEGLGPGRRRALLTALGGLAQVKRASIDELARIEGISRTIAERVYAYFH